MDALAAAPAARTATDAAVSTALITTQPESIAAPAVVAAAALIKLFTKLSPCCAPLRLYAPLRLLLRLLFFLFTVWNHQISGGAYGFAGELHGTHRAIHHQAAGLDYGRGGGVSNG
jgi:hypothetical protein